MYKVCRNNGEFDVTTTIQGNDIYNSEFLNKLDSINTCNIYPYEYNKGRLDLVSKCMYNADAYYSIPAIYSRKIINNDTSIKGVCFPYQKSIDELLNK